jgi:hypothetical protein
MSYDKSMRGFRELHKFDSNMHVEFAMGTKHAMKGFRIVSFHMDLGGTLRVEDVLWVPECKRSVISVAMIEKKGFDVAFQNGKGLIMPKGSISNKEDVFRVRDKNLYRIKGHPIVGEIYIFNTLVQWELTN